MALSMHGIPSTEVYSTLRRVPLLLTMVTKYATTSSANDVPTNTRTAVVTTPHTKYRYPPWAI